MKWRRNRACLERYKAKMKNKELTRIFIAIEFPSDIVKEIARIQELISKVKFTGKLTELENLHLTLKFFGEVDDIKLGKIKEALKKVEFSKMDLKLGKAGTFSVGGNPRIVWKIGR